MLVLASGLTLSESACGRMGPLEPPVAAGASAPAASSEAGPGGFAAKKAQPITPPKQPFVLDPLL